MGTVLGLGIVVTLSGASNYIASRLLGHDPVECRRPRPHGFGVVFGTVASGWWTALGIVLILVGAVGLAV